MHWQDYRMERAWQYADFLMQTVKQRPAELLKQIKSETKWKSLQQKLSDIYVAGCSTTFKNKNLFGGSHLLEKLVAREKLNCLIVNLYAGNEGYSLMLKTRTGGDTETIRLPYEEGEILQYIDNEELPPLLIDLLERSQANLFYNGCVIVEVRDYRRTSNPSTCDYRHVLLRPTTQSIISDVGMLTSDGQRWTWDERQALEANLLLATSEPLCLDPSISVAILANHLHYRKHLFSRRTFKRLARKHSQATINKKRKFEHCTAPPNLKLYDFLAKRRNKLGSQPIVGLKLSKQVVDNWKRPDVHLEAPSVLEVEKVAKVIPKPDIKDGDMIVAEEHIMEAEKSTGKICQNRITILYSPLEELYYGKLCSGQDPSQTETKCFHLGSKCAVTKYVKQFKRIFTQEGRKRVKMTHIVPGQPPKVKFTTGIMEISAAALNAVSISTDTTSTSGESKTVMETEPPPSKKMLMMPKLSSPITNSASNVQDIKSPPTRTAALTSLIATETSPSSLAKNQSSPTTSINNQVNNNDIALSPVSSPSSAEVIPPAPQSSSHNPLAVENLVSPPQNLISTVNLSGFGIGIPGLVTLSSMTPSAAAVISIANPTQPSSASVVTGIGSKNTSNLTTTSSMSSSISSIGSMITSGEVTAPPIDIEGMVSDIAPAVLLSSGNIAAQLMTPGLKVSNLRSSSQTSLQITNNQVNPVITEAHNVRSTPPNITPISPWSSVPNISTHSSNQQKSPSSTGDGSSPLQSSSIPAQRRHKLQVPLQKQLSQQPRQQHTPPSSSSRTKAKKKSSSGSSSK